MALFGSSRDISFIIKINNELLDNIIQQEVDYYKLYLPETKSKDTSNLYGEASAQKTYYTPVRLTCLMEWNGNESIEDDQFGIDINQIVNFKFLRPRLEELGLVPQIGDIIEARSRYYEVDNAQEIQYVMGKDKDYPKNVGAEFGRNISIQCATHLARVSRLQIVKARV